MKEREGREEVGEQVKKGRLSMDCLASVLACLLPADHSWRCGLLQFYLLHHTGCGLCVFSLKDGTMDTLQYKLIIENDDYSALSVI